MTYRGMTVETIKINGDKGDPISAYVARPSGSKTLPGIVLVHHLPGWSEIYCEMTRKFAHHGYLAICHNLYERSGQGNPDDVAAKVRAEGGVPDAQVIGDTEASRSKPARSLAVAARCCASLATPTIWSPSRSTFIATGFRPAARKHATSRSIASG